MKSFLEFQRIDEVNHREHAQAGKVHPTMAKHMTVGQEHDFYHSKTGDKISGVVKHKTDKEVHLQANKDGKLGGGETHKFSISEETAPWETEAEAKKREKSAFKKPNNPNRTGMDSARALAMRGLAAAKKKQNEEVELDEATTGNEGYGYHGQHHSTNAAVAYKRAHALVKKHAGEAGHLKDAKNPGKMVTHYLDSTHGRHLKGNENAEYIKKDFGKFKKNYKPEMHEEVELEEATVKTQKYEGGKVMTVHHGASHSYPLHPEHQEAIRNLKHGEKTSFKDETGAKVNVHRDVQDVHFTSNKTAARTTVPHSHFELLHKESAPVAPVRHRYARAVPAARKPPGHHPGAPARGNPVPHAGPRTAAAVRASAPAAKCPWT